MNISSLTTVYRRSTMANQSYYQSLLQERSADIALGSTILIIIGALVGMIGNSLIIHFYFFRIKERGERYFIPLLAIVDFTGCITSSSFYVMDNTFLFNYPSSAACRLLSFLQICIPGISGHVLLIISIQRYLLICKPFGPKMTLFWKRFAFGIACIISIVYSVPLLKTSGVSEEDNASLGYNFTTYICRFSVGSSPGMPAYFALLFLIMVANLSITAGLYIPVLKRINISRGFKNKNYHIQNENNISSQTESSNAPEIEMDGNNHEKTDIETQPKFINDSCRKGKFKPSEGKSNVSKVVQINKQVQTGHGAKEKNPVSKSDAAQKRITIMFFVLILAYIISYTPPLIISIVFYALDGFTFITMSKAELAMCFYLTRLVFLNHIVNPFVYGYFDTMFRNGLVKLCTRKKSLPLA